MLETLVNDVAGWNQSGEGGTLGMVQPDGLRAMKWCIIWVGKVCGRELVEIGIIVGKASGLWDFAEL
jgi:hypothetical protein